jgi:hypothetical protein
VGAAAAAAVTATGASETDTASRGADEALRLVPLSATALALAAIRIALGCAGAGVARARGLDGGVALAEFLFGTGALAFAALADPRNRFLSLRGEPEAVPAGVSVEPVARAALTGMYPSTLALSALTIAALAFDPKLAAVLAGAIAGLGVAALVSGGQTAWQERSTRARLYADRRSKRLFARSY